MLIDPRSGVNFMEKTITLRNTEITFSIWDLGGQREFLSMLPLVSVRTGMNMCVLLFLGSVHETLLVALEFAHACGD